MFESFKLNVCLGALQRECYIKEYIRFVKAINRSSFSDKSYLLKRHLNIPIECNGFIFGRLLNGFPLVIEIVTIISNSISVICNRNISIDRVSFSSHRF